MYIWILWDFVDESQEINEQKIPMYFRKQKLCILDEHYILQVDN